MKNLVLCLLALASCTVAAAGSFSITLQSSPEKGTFFMTICDEKTWKSDDAQNDCLASNMKALNKGDSYDWKLNNIPEGDYVIKAFLDTNGNNKLDTNLFGYPK